MADDPLVAQWNERYTGDDYIFGEAPNAFLAAQAALLRSGMKALAVADGEGRNGVWLAKHGLEVTAVDFSPVALAKSRKLAAREGVAVTTECADLLTWDWGRDRFDLIAVIFIQFGPAERAAFFDRLKTALKPGGLTILQAYTPKQLTYRTGGPPQLDHLYTADMLRAVFAGYEILNLREHEEPLGEGKRHIGMSALVDLVARKPQERTSRAA
jgi:cyclopropane fatty-acyl-phospholipid synthase-like methyltransferase